MEKNSERSLFVALFRTEIVIYLFSFTVGIFITRDLGPNDKGVQSFILSVNDVLISVFSFGFSGGVRYYAIKKFDFENSEVTVLWSSILISFIGFLLFLIFMSFLPDRYYSQYIEGIGVYNLAIVFGVSILNLVLSKLFLSRELYKVDNNARLIKIFIYIIFVSYFVLLLRLRVKGFVYGLLITQIVVMLYNIWQFRRLVRFKSVLIFNTQLFYNYLSYGVKTLPGEIVRVSNKRLDQLILSAFISPSLLSFFAIAVILSEMVMLIPQTLFNYAYNKMGNSGNEDAFKFTRLVNSATFTFFCFYYIFIIMYGDELINLLYGKDFFPAYDVLVCYLPGVGFLLSTRVILRFFASKGFVSVVNKVHGVGMIMGLPITFLLIKYYGLIGGALGSTVNYFLINLYTVGKFHKQLSRKFSLLFFLFTVSDLKVLRKKLM